MFDYFLKSSSTNYVSICPILFLNYVTLNITLKLPILSATTPAKGGMMMVTMGVTADMMAASSTLIPSSLM